MRINIPKPGDILTLTEDWVAEVSNTSRAANELLKSLPPDTAGKAYMKLARLSRYRRDVTIPSGTKLKVIYVKPDLNCIRLDIMGKPAGYGLIVTVANASRIEYEFK